MSVDRAALHKFVTGSEKVGEYPDAQWARWDGIRRDLLAECRQRGVEVHLTGSTDQPVHASVPTFLADVAAQLGERWPDPTRKDGRSWTLLENIEQIRLCALALDAVDNPRPTPVDPGTGGLPGGVLPPGTALGSLKWAADLAKDGVLGAGFKSTNWNTEHGPAWPPPVGVFAGRRAIKFALGPGGKRIEVEPNHQTFPNSGEAWFGFQFYLENDFPIDSRSWHLIWQLHGNDTTSPVFALQVHKGGLDTGINSGPIAPLSKGRWYQCVVRAEFGAGRHSTWLDGKLVHDRIKVGQSNPPYYLKVGSYQDTAIGTGTIYQTAWRLGSGYGSVVPGMQ